MWSRILALILVLALWPALGETVEIAMHLAQHGDLAHEPTDHHDGSPLGADEHGCSGTFHLCASGHVSALSAPRVTVVVTRPSRTPAPAIAAPLDELGRDAPIPPIRPPIA